MLHLIMNNEKPNMDLKGDTKIITNWEQDAFITCNGDGTYYVEVKASRDLQKICCDRKLKPIYIRTAAKDFREAFKIGIQAFANAQDPVSD